MSEDGSGTVVEGAFFGDLLDEPKRLMVEAMRGGCCRDWFVNPFWQCAWTAAENLWKAHQLEGIDGYTIFTEMKRLAADEKGPFKDVEVDMKPITEVVERSTPGTFGYYCDLLKKAELARKLSKACAKMARELPSTDPSTAGEELNRNVLKVLSEAAGAKEIKLHEVTDGIVKQARDAHHIRIDLKDLNFVPGIPLPWPEMTKGINGLQPGLNILAARPSVGKTAFVLQMVRFWCEHGIHVAFNCLDMPITPFLQRPIAEVSRVSIYKYTFGTTSLKDLKKIEEAKKRVDNWTLTLVEERDVDAFRSWCYVQKMCGKADVIVVDFLQLMSFKDSGRKTDNEVVQYVSGTLKTIARELNVPVIALSQLNRECTRDGGRDPNVSDLRGSGSLEQDALTISLLYRDSDVEAAWKKDPPIALVPGCNPDSCESLSPIWWSLEKSQNGRHAKLPFVCYQNYFCFMLADYAARPGVISEGYGAAKKERPDNAPRFARVHPDWRHDGLELELVKTGGLIRDSNSLPNA